MPDNHDYVYLIYWCNYEQESTLAVRKTLSEAKQLAEQELREYYEDNDIIPISNIKWNETKNDKLYYLGENFSLNIYRIYFDEGLLCYN